MITVLVADDSFLMRKLITDILTSDPDIRVVGTASDGEQAVEMAKKLQPDVITMDLNMPKLTGIDAVRTLMTEAGRRPIVIMLSAFTKETATNTFDCLRAGAFSCVQKPSGTVSLNIDSVRSELLSQVRSAARARREALSSLSAPRVTKKAKSANANPASSFALVVIGASTGGPPVLEDIFSHLTSGMGAAVLVVQHMPEKFTASLAERLDGQCALNVKQAAEGDIVKPGMAFIARGDSHLELRKNIDGDRVTYSLHLTKDAPVQGLRPSIDVLLHSVADQFSGQTLGIILTGMGQDGKIGIRALKKAGGHIVVQDPKTCVVDGMVQSVLEDSNADKTLNPEHIADEINSLLHA